MKRVYEYKVLKGNITINDYLAFLEYPNSLITFLKKHNKQVLLNGIPTKTTTILLDGDILSIILLEEGNNKTKPIISDIDILYEDEDLYVINKPSHMPVHTSLGYMDCTLQNVLKHYHPNIMFHCISRLDTDTTGLIIIAKNQLVTALFAKQKIEKEYLAFVIGNPHSGTVDKPIYKVEEQIKRVIDESGKQAITHYETLKVFDNYSLIKLHLETGRTHQIRLHMSSIGHPLIGDKMYNPIPDDFPRYALHVYHLKFIHPISKEIMEFYCPLPLDMSNLLQGESVEELLLP